MPIVCPSRTGNATAPKSRTMWRISADASSPVSRKLPLTVAIAGLASECKLTAGRAADHGAGAVPPCPTVASDVIATISSGITSSPAASTVLEGGSASHENCSSSEYGLARGTWRQLSIAPVGQGATQALQLSQIAGSTT